MAGMTAAEYQTATETALALLRASDTGDGAYESFMDQMTQACSDEQWTDLVARLDAEIDAMKATAKAADAAQQRVPSFRPAVRTVDIFGGPESVWLIWRDDYNEVNPTLIDVAATRQGAANLAEDDAGELWRDQNPTSRGVSWRKRWQKAAAGCPCPTMLCGHELWSRQTRAGLTYRIHGWRVERGTDQQRPGAADPSV